MSHPTLPKDLTSLVHHIELSKAGWRKEAIRLLLLAVIAKSDEGTLPDNAYDDLNRSLPNPVGKPDLEKALNSLRSDSKVICLDDGRHRLSEATRVDYLDKMRDADELLRNVTIVFQEVFDVLPDDGQVTWDDFREAFLVPLVYELGARTYQVITGTQVLDVQATRSYLQFVSRFTDDSQPFVCQSIFQFLDPREQAVRHYVLRLLNTAFLIQALIVPSSSVDALVKRTTQPIRFTIFVDTNYLISLLGLDDHPANEVVNALRSIVSRGIDGVNIKFYVLPFTIAEALRTIASYSDQLTTIQLSRQLARAVREENSGLSGIPLTYVKNACAGPKPVSAKDYFAPYLTNLIDIARTKGVELYNAPIGNLSTDQEVVDDLNTQMEHDRSESERRTNFKPKPYEAMLHDMMLWHFAKKRRPAMIGSALDAKSWVATLDYGLIRFDENKKAKQHPPVCIHPSILLQILQLWIPSSESLDFALINSLRPMIPRRFDQEAEKTTIRIMRALSRYEIGDLDHDTVARILLDDAVRSRIESSGSEDEEWVVVKNAVRVTNRNTSEELKEQQERNKQLEEDNRIRQSQIADLEHDIARLQKELDQEASKRKYETANRQRMDDRVVELEREARGGGEKVMALSERYNQLEKKFATVRVIVAGVVSAVICWGLLGCLAWLTSFAWGQNSNWQQYTIVVCIVLGAGVGAGAYAIRLAGRKMDLPR